MKYSVKSINPRNTAIISAIWCASISVILIPFFLLMLLFQPQAGVPAWTNIFVLFIPVFYGVMGFASAYLACLIYNFIARKFVKFEIELEQVSVDSAES